MSEETITVPVNGSPIVDPFASPVEKPKKGRKPRKKAPGEAAGTRREDDAYDTPPELALACARWCKAWVTPVVDHREAYPVILDPCAGSGPFVMAAAQVWQRAKIGAVDIRPECAQLCRGAGANAFVPGDALALPTAQIAKVDLILTNPPFKLADALARHFWAGMKPGASLALLLSVTFIGSSDRWEPDATGEYLGGLFMVAPLRYMVPIVPRPSFTGDSPKFEAALFVWVKGEQWEKEIPTIIPRDPIRWVKPRKERAGASEE